MTNFFWHFSKILLAICFRIKQPRWEQIAGECKEIFNPDNKNKQHCLQFFYSCYQKKTSCTPEAKTAGFLYNRYAKLRDKLIEAGIIQKKDYSPDGNFWREIRKILE